MHFMLASWADSLYEQGLWRGTERFRATIFCDCRVIPDDGIETGGRVTPAI